MAKPYCCPVCEGKGVLPCGFYNPNMMGITYNTNPEICKSCNGTGVIWLDELVVIEEKKD